MNNRLKVGLPSLVLLSLGARAAQASTLFATEFSGSTPLYTVNQATGAITAGPGTGVSDIGDLTSSGSASMLYANNIATKTLYGFNTGTGATMSSVVLDSPDVIVSIAYNGINGSLYGTSDTGFGGNNTLWSINAGTGHCTLVGNFGVSSMFSLAFNNSGVLYGTDEGAAAGPRLWTLNTATAVATPVGFLAPTSANFDIAFRPEDGVLFMASSGSANMYTVNPATAAPTLLGPYGSFTNIAGLAFSPAVPEPASVLALGGGLLVLARRRRSRA